MEDSFSVRVDRVFGSLSSSSSSNPLSSSLWSLTDEEIEKKEWNRDTETPDDADAEAASFPSGVDGFFANRKSVDDENRPRDFGLRELEDDLQCIDDEAEETDVVRGRRRGSRLEEDENDELDIKDSIGMDCTLDYEEEEDEYDKVAVGREGKGERIYMHDVKDYGIHVSSHHELPTSFREAHRDPRANRLAAKLRLKEDAEAARNLHSSQAPSEMAMSTQDDPSGAIDERNDLKSGSDEMMVAAQEDRDNASESGKQVKSILKRKENQKGSPAKRVRFVPGCKEEDKEDVPMGTVSNEEESHSLQQGSAAVPDYLRNPSKYTRYTFDETNDLDERSNQQGYMDFLNVLRKSKQSGSDEPPADLSQPVIFTPKRKARDASAADNGNKTEQHKDTVVEDFSKKRSVPISMAGEDSEENDVCAMEEASPPMEASKICSRKRTSRQYRSKNNEELDELVA